MSLSSTQSVGQARSGVSACRGRRRVVEGPGEDAADVVAMVVLAGLFGLVAEDALVDADVVVVTEVGFDDVVEVDAGGGPLGEDGGGGGGDGQGRERGCNQNGSKRSHRRQQAVGMGGSVLAERIAAVNPSEAAKAPRPSGAVVAEWLEHSPIKNCVGDILESPDGGEDFVDLVVDGLIDGYVADLVERGLVRSAGVERAFRAVPRHWFVEGFWVAGREAAYDVGVDSPSTEALKVVYSDEALITRRDAKGDPTSSASQPAVVAMMLEALDLKPGLRVLEIGAGTGYNAALMAEVVGDQRLVTTIDIDADVVAQTGRLLARAGYGAIETICGDGALGCAESAPFDRIVATVGCSDISWDWVDQLRPDGLLLVPLEHGGSHPLVKLRVLQPGRLVGRIVGWSGFMRMRGDLETSGPWPSSPPDFGGRPPDEVLPLFPALERALRSQPAGVDREVEWWRVPGAWYDFHFFLSLCDVRAYRGPEGLGLVDDDGGCAALVRPNGICVWGRSGLYQRLEAACGRWEQLGMPELRCWEVEFIPRTAGLPNVHESTEVFVVERGRSRQLVRLSAA